VIVAHELFAVFAYGVTFGVLSVHDPAPFETYPAWQTPLTQPAVPNAQVPVAPVNVHDPPPYETYPAWQTPLMQPTLPGTHVPAAPVKVHPVPFET
jgi:hypothetical protein